MTRGRGDVERERIIKDRQSVKCYGCHRLGHTRAECHINPWRDQQLEFSENATVDQYMVL